MDSVCRSFAARLERRRNLVILSVRFHRLVEETTKHLDELLELLITEVVAETVEDAERQLNELAERMDFITNLAEQALNEGQNLLDLLSLPIKNAFGHSVTPDHKAHVEHVQKLLAQVIHSCRIGGGEKVLGRVGEGKGEVEVEKIRREDRKEGKRGGGREGREEGRREERREGGKRGGRRRK